MADERRVIELLREADPGRAPLATPSELDPMWQTIVGRIERGHDPEGSPNGTVAGRIGPPLTAHEQARAEHDRAEQDRAQQDRAEQDGAQQDRAEPHRADQDEGEHMSTQLERRDSRHARTPTSQEQPAWWSRAAVVLVVAAAVAVGLWVLAQLGANGEVITDEQGVPVPVNDFVEAFNAGDAAAVEAALAENAILLGEGRPLTGETSRLPRWNANMFALDATLELDGCAPTDASSDANGEFFTCRLTGSTSVSRAVGEHYQSQVSFAIEGDQITGHDALFGVLDPADSVLPELGNYLFDNHFEAYDEACGATYDPMTVGPECMEFLETYLDEFAASR